MSDGKVCEARERAYDRLPYDVLCNIIDGRGTEPPPDDPTLLVPCPALDAPHPGCGAAAGEACRANDTVPRDPRCECDGDGCGWCRPDATPETDVGDLRAEIERLRKRAERAEGLAKAERALRLAYGAWTWSKAGPDAGDKHRAYVAAQDALIAAGGAP